MIEYVLAAVWGAGVATLWWAFACLKVSEEYHSDLLTWAVITSVLTLIGLIGLACYDREI